MNRKALTRGEAVVFYTADPKDNPEYTHLIESIESDGRLRDGEKEMLEYTVETIFGIGYSIYDHLYFHTHDMMKVMDVKSALMTADRYETKMIQAVKNEILPIVFQRAYLYAQSHGSSQAYIFWVKKLQENALKIMQYNKRGVSILKNKNHISSSGL